MFLLFLSHSNNIMIEQRPFINEVCLLLPFLFILYFIYKQDMCFSPFKLVLVCWLSCFISRTLYIGWCTRLSVDEPYITYIENIALLPFKVITYTTTVSDIPGTFRKKDFGYTQ